MTNDPIEAWTEGAKAVSSTAEAVSKVVDAASALTRAGAATLGPIVRDIVSIAGGAWLHETRVRNESKLKARTEQFLNERCISAPEAVSPSIILPLIDAARDESRDELQDLWARLLAAAMTVGGGVRAEFIETAKKLEPFDVVILEELWKHPEPQPSNPTYQISIDFGRGMDEVVVSIDNLVTLKCVFRDMVAPMVFRATPYGKELIRACYGKRQ